MYQFFCENCSKDPKDVRVADHCNISDEINGNHPRTGEYIFFLYSTMKDKPSKPKCPNCGSSKTGTSLLDNSITCYVRGDGIVKDKAGARRDMNKFHLVNQDPYGHMRVSGEVDHMLDQIRDAGRDMGKVRSDRAKSSQEAKKTANKIKYAELSEEQKGVLLKISELGNVCGYDDLKGFDDANKIIGSLMPDFICKSKDRFMLMAAGRSYVDSILNS